MPEIHQGFWFPLSFQSDLYHLVAAQHIKWQVRVPTLIEDNNNWNGGWRTDIVCAVWAIFSLSDKKSIMGGLKIEQTASTAAETGAFVLAEWLYRRSATVAIWKYIIHIHIWKHWCNITLGPNLIMSCQSHQFQLLLVAYWKPGKKAEHF